jgi:integrase
MLQETFDQLLAVAERVHPLLPLALIVAESTGRRLSSWRQLKWSDINMKQKTIKWRAEIDKGKKAQTAPVSAKLIKILETQKKLSKSVWLFPSPGDDSEPCDRYIMDGWLRRAFEVGEIPKEKGQLWHSLRRKWATDRKKKALVDVASAGGWRDTSTLLRYQKSDMDSQRDAMENAP